MVRVVVVLNVESERLVMCKMYVMRATITVHVKSVLCVRYAVHVIYVARVRFVMCISI